MNHADASNKLLANAATSVAVVIATFKRVDALGSLLRSLGPPSSELREIILVDNGSDPATRRLAESSALAVRYVDPGTNLTCGGGVKLGLELALANPCITHCWILDDDAVSHVDALASLLEGMRVSGADAAVPIVLNGDGNVGWPPGLLDAKACRRLREQNLLPQDFVARHGTEPLPFSWCPWPSLLVTRRAIEVAGLPREDFWIAGEDLEFSLRITARLRGVLVPMARCSHLPPEGTNRERVRRQHYLKFCSMLQNLSYCTLRLPHTRRILKHLPGNYLRFIRTFGFTSGSITDACRAFWWGAIRGRTAGSPGFQQFRDRYLAL